MTFYSVFRIVLLLIVAAMLGYNLYHLDEMEQADTLPNTQKRYQPYQGSGLLLAVLATLFLGDMLFMGRSLSEAFHNLAVVGVLAFFYATVYYALLLLLLPWLRRRISARTCGFLWLVPNFLYLSFYSGLQMQRPTLVLHPPVKFLPLLGWIWLAGMVLVLGRSIVSHLRFRQEILRDAVPEADPAVLEIWTAEQHRAGYHKAPYRLVRSPAVQTPLSIGFWKRTIRVVLPQQPYTAEELPLVLRHELVHIGRADAHNKLFLTLCTALCWFNPLMWIAMRRSAEDFELSCDETVLLNADTPTRRRYAELLLTTGGDQRGFTTCLSSSAQSLRYRLKAVLSPAKRSLGALALMVSVLLVTLPFGTVTFAWDRGTVEDWVFAGNPEACTVESLFYHADPAEHLRFAQKSPDAAPLLAYLGGLELEQVAGMYAFSTVEDPILYLYGHTEDAQITINLWNDMLILHIRGRDNQTHAYHLPQPPDWDTVASLLAEA